MHHMMRDIRSREDTSRIIYISCSACERDMTNALQLGVDVRDETGLDVDVDDALSYPHPRYVFIDSLCVGLKTLERPIRRLLDDGTNVVARLSPDTLMKTQVHAKVYVSVHSTPESVRAVLQHFGYTPEDMSNKPRDALASFSWF